MRPVQQRDLTAETANNKTIRLFGPPTPDRKCRKKRLATSARGGEKLVEHPPWSRRTKNDLRGPGGPPRTASRRPRPRGGRTRAARSRGGRTGGFAGRLDHTESGGEGGAVRSVHRHRRAPRDRMSDEEGGLPRVPEGWVIPGRRRDTHWDPDRQRRRSAPLPPPRGACARAFFFSPLLPQLPHAHLPQRCMHK